MNQEMDKKVNLRSRKILDYFRTTLNKSKFLINNKTNIFKKINQSVLTNKK